MSSWPANTTGRARLAMLLAVAAGFVFTGWGQTTPGTGADEAAKAAPVLVELFTSEGCSDCPPADALLARLDATQFVPGARAIVLSEHVTYWDHQGWRDPFSLDVVTDRQHRYGTDFGLNDIYTPQMVVDGVQQFVGSNADALTRAVAHAAGLPKAELAIANAQWADGAVRFSVTSPANTKSKLTAVLAEDATHSEVAHGENAGRTLYHVAVVRVLREFGSNAADGRPLQLPTPAAALKENAQGPIRLVVFLTDRRTGRVVTAAEQTLTQ